MFGGKTEGPAVFDEQELLQRCCGDAEIAAGLITLFERESPLLLHDLRNSIERRDRAALQRILHRLKGSAGNLAAKRVYERTQTIERSLEAAEGETHFNSAMIETLNAEVTESLSRMSEFRRRVQNR